MLSHHVLAIPVCSMEPSGFRDDERHPDMALQPDCEQAMQLIEKHLAVSL